MSDGQMKWIVPVITFPDSQRRQLEVTIENGDVVVDPPRVPFSVPLTSIPLMCDALQEAGAIVRQMGREL